MNHRLHFWLHLWKACQNTHRLNMTKANKFTCPGGALRAAWACLGVAPTRSRVLPALLTCLGLVLTGQATAQTFTTLYRFTDGGDGGNPEAGLVLSGNILYGTAENGGSAGHGTVFAVNTDGTGFTNLYSFTNGSDGALPASELILSGNTLYGTAVGGGSIAPGYGTVFAVNTDGTGFKTLYSFTSGSLGRNGGGEPYAGLILSGSTLYGVAANGGSGGGGTVFAVNTNGTGFKTLYNFTDGSDGDGPLGFLTLSGNTLYGTAYGGGSGGFGTVFAVNTNGTGFRTLHSFTSVTQIGTNSDGTHPEAGLVLSSNTLYGTAAYGGASGNGTLFALNTDGTGFTTLYSFTNGSYGANPTSALVLSGDTLYGTASGGGAYGYGTVFSLSLPSVTAPQLTITPSGGNVVLTWPTNYSGFTLQSTTNLGSSAVWSTNSPPPVVLNGQNVVTNPISGAQQFFRLSQ